MDCNEVRNYLMPDDSVAPPAGVAHCTLDRAAQAAVHISDCRACRLVLDLATALATGGVHGNAVAVNNARREKA